MLTDESLKLPDICPILKSLPADAELYFRIQLELSQSLDLPEEEQYTKIIHAKVIANDVDSDVEFQVGRIEAYWMQVQRCYNHDHDVAWTCFDATSETTAIFHLFDGEGTLSPAVIGAGSDEFMPLKDVVYIKSCVIHPAIAGSMLGLRSVKSLLTLLDPSEDKIVIYQPWPINVEGASEAELSRLARYWSRLGNFQPCKSDPSFWVRYPDDFDFLTA